MILTLDQQIDALIDYSLQPVHRIKTGFPTVDDLCGGPAPGEVFTIIGRSYTGKSVVAQNIIRNNPNVPSIFFSMEMPYIQALIRLYAMWTDTPAWKVQQMVDDGDVPSEFRELAHAFPKHRIIDQVSLSVEQMSRYVHAFADQVGQRPEFVVIDYLELVGGAKVSAEGYKATESQIAQLKDFAKSENLRVFVVHQCNMREPIYEPPTEDSPRGGGFAESDFMIGLWRPHRNPELPPAEAQYLKDKLFVNVLKNRAYFDLADEIVMRFTPSLRLQEEWSAQSNRAALGARSDEQSRYNTFSLTDSGDIVYLPDAY